MRRRCFVAVAAVAVALSSGAAGANHSYHHRYSYGGSMAGGYVPLWIGPSWYPYYYGMPLLLSPNLVGPWLQAPQAGRPGGAAGAGKAAQSAKRKVRVSNPAAVARAKEFLKFGDDHFRAQHFAGAYQRYKKAASAAPDVAEAHFRQGFSLLALGNYRSASKAILRGLALQPDWARSKFRLDDLYGDNRLAKTRQLEQLAQAAGDGPENAKLMFLLGVELFFDGQGERARKFFVRAGDLGEDPSHLDGFLKALGPGRAAAPPAPKRNGRLQL